MSAMGRDRRAVVLAVPVVLVGLALAACAPAPSEPDPTPPAVDSGAPQIPGEKRGVVAATSVPEDVPDAVELRAGTEITSCEAEDGTGTAKGVVGNPTDDDASYVVTVFFTTDAATVVGSGQTTVDVAAGDQAEWTVSAEFAAPSETLCALRGVGPAS